MSTWAVLRVTVQQERLTLGALLELGLTAYAPMWITHALRAKRKATRTRPLIPGYVFVDLPDDRAINLARSVHGVREIMCRDGKPRFVPANAIGALILAEAAHEFDETWTPPKIKGARYSHRWKPGDRVEMATGPLRGFIGEVLKAKGKSRMEVLFMVFGRVNEVTVEHRDLRAPTEHVAPRRAA